MGFNSAFKGLNQMAAMLLCSFRLTFLYEYISPAFLFFISNLIHCFFVYVQYLLSSFLYMFQASQAHHQEV